MKITDRILKTFGLTRFVQMRQKRSWQAAQNINVLSDWPTTQKTADQEIRLELRALRARSRDLCQNDPYAKKYLKLRRMNVVGADGFTLKMQAGEYNKGQFKPDEYANRIIKEKWLDWCRKENASVTGNQSFWDICNLVSDHSARDGEFLVRKIKSNSFKYGFKLQVLEPDLLNERLNIKKEEGRIIRMGVEIDEWRKPTAYMITKVDPSIEVFYTGDYSWSFDRVPAEEIYHGFDKERAFQTRGVPILAASMFRIKQLQGYIEAALINARLTAAKMGYFETAEGGSYQGESTDSDGNFIVEAEPGINTQLPVGVKFVASHPEYPTAQHQMFVSSIEHDIAAGLNVSYMSLTGDLTGASYSSARIGSLEERDHWKTVQTWMIESFLEPVFEDWLREAFLSGQFGTLPFSKFDKFNAPEFVGRRWGWVDPKNDVEAKILAIQAGLATITDTVAEQGGDIRDQFDTLAEEKALAKEKGIMLSVDMVKPLSKLDATATQGAPEQGAQPAGGLKSLAEIIVERTNGHS